MRQLVESITGIFILFSTGQCVSEIPTGEELFDQQQKITYGRPIEDHSLNLGRTFASSHQLHVDQAPFARIGVYG